MPEREAKYTWLAYIAAFFLLVSESFHLVTASYRTQNGFIVECIEWVDLSAIIGGGAAAITFLLFFAINSSNPTFGWKKWIRVFAFVEALRVMMYGFGIDVGIGEGCDHIV